MARSNNRKVSIKVDEYFFKNIFEPTRRELGIKLGVNFSQTGFTNYLHRSGAKIVFPKMKKMPKQKIRRINTGFGGVPFGL